MVELNIGDVAASKDTETFNVTERKCRYIFYVGCAQAKVLCALYVLESESRTEVVFHRAELHITLRDVPDVPNKSAVRRHSPEHVGLSVLVFRFGG